MPIAIDRATANHINPLISQLHIGDTLDTAANVINDLSRLVSESAGDNPTVYLAFEAVAAALRYEVQEWSGVNHE